MATAKRKSKTSGGSGANGRAAGKGRGRAPASTKATRSSRKTGSSSSKAGAAKASAPARREGAASRARTTKGGAGAKGARSSNASAATLKPARKASARSMGRAKIRYGVVGLGHIVQVAVLPAFAHASSNSELVALVSDDDTKLSKLGRKYGVEARHRYTYERFGECLASGEIDAVYIGLPNHMHHAYTLQAAEAGVHVLCEKPMAIDERECREMIRACRSGGVRLMIAYRLHFEKANLLAIELASSGRLGELKYFGSLFSQQVTDPDNIRLSGEKGGGPLCDIGIYCINAARSLFRAEPEEVMAQIVPGSEARFAEVEEQASVLMRFPGGRLASFVCSFSATDVSTYEVVGSRGRLRLDPAYDYAEELRHELSVDGRTREKRFPQRDQFAPELLHFSECIQERREPEPSGEEGLADVRVLEALFRSGREGRAVRLEPFERTQRPSMEQEIRRPAVEKPEEVHARGPSS